MPSFTKFEIDMSSEVAVMMGGHLLQVICGYYSGFYDPIQSVIWSKFKYFKIDQIRFH